MREDTVQAECWEGRGTKMRKRGCGVCMIFRATRGGQIGCDTDAIDDCVTDYLSEVTGAKDGI